VKLIPATWDKQSRVIDGTAVIPMETLQLGSIASEQDRLTARKTIETSLVKNVKSFVGFQIETLYDFFMVFVVMSGISAIILYVLSRKLLTMMHGVR